MRTGNDIHGASLGVRLYGLAFAGLKLTASMDEPARCASAARAAVVAPVFLILVIVAGFVGEPLKPLHKLQAVSQG